MLPQSLEWPFSMPPSAAVGEHALPEISSTYSTPCTGWRASRWLSATRQPIHSRASHLRRTACPPSPLSSGQRFAQAPLAHVQTFLNIQNARFWGATPAKRGHLAIVIDDPARCVEPCHALTQRRGCAGCGPAAGQPCPDPAVCHGEASSWSQQSISGGWHSLQ